MDVSFGQISCTATVAMRVKKKPASWRCPGQTIFVKSSFQFQNPTAVPIKLAISVIFQVVMNSPWGFLYDGVLSLFRDGVLKVAIEP